MLARRMYFQLIGWWLVIQETYTLIIKAPHDRIIMQRSSGRNALSKPNITSWELESHYLILNWEHTVDSSQHVNGYYVSLCKLTNSLCIGPDFVNFKSFVRSGRIVGLAPEQAYQVEVIAYNSEEHTSSDSVTVNTKNLNFLQAKNFTVSLVTCCSAVFYWTHEPKHNVHDVEFFLQCKGQREYVNLHKKLVQEEHHFEQICSSSSRDYETLVIKTLQANTRYSCALSSMAGTIKSPPSQQLAFTTYPGSPTVPPTPVLSLSTDYTFTASLYPTDEQFGKVSHYLLVAVPVTKSKNDPLTAPYQPIVPLKSILSKALSSKTVMTIDQPLPFIVATFGSKGLPTNYNFGYEWRSVFKQKTYYSVVLAAFVRGKESRMFHSLSALSRPVYITEDLVQSWVEAQRPVAKKFTIIVVVCIVSVVILFSVAFLILFLSNYYSAKRRDAKNEYIFAIANTDSSEEDEIFSKGEVSHELLGDDVNRPMSSQRSENLQYGGNFTAITEKAPTMTHAEWVMENMSRSPAFREMVTNHPEALGEMKDVMSSIGHQWEARVPANTQQQTGNNFLDVSDSSLSEPIYSRTQPPVPTHRSSSNPHRLVQSQNLEGQSSGSYGREQLSDVDLSEQYYYS